MTDRARRARENRQGARAEGTVRSAARGSRRGHLSQLKSAAQAKRARETSRKRSFIAHHSPPARPLHTRSTIPGTSTASKTFFRARRAMLGRARARTPPRQHETRPSSLSRRWWRRCRWTPIPLSVRAVPRRKAEDMPALGGCAAGHGRRADGARQRLVLGETAAVPGGIDLQETRRSSRSGHTCGRKAAKL
jgi:hypothetical protein